MLRSTDAKQTAAYVYQKENKNQDKWIKLLEFKAQPIPAATLPDKLPEGNTSPLQDIITKRKRNSAKRSVNMEVEIEYDKEEEQVSLAPLTGASTRLPPIIDGGTQSLDDGKGEDQFQQ